ncbi:hypothetical protein [Actinokineospora sp. NBRC 105648]|uniref:hypothetical protein n=1 Tax=Actinokineospora sp. NBRC 105648 TaxID=3032206 RepID=UPI0025565670|nr:hypothetical protein [Actinokineospora sp. NBRC 105648]
MDQRLHRLLAEAVGRYFDSVERLAARQQHAVAVELRRLVAAWRVLLGLHLPQRRHCAACDRPRLARAGPRYPVGCTVWRVAGAYFVRSLPVDEPRARPP